MIGQRTREWKGIGQRRSDTGRRRTPLTEREKSTVQRVLAGLSNKTIAEADFVTAQQVCVRIRRICWKLGIEGQLGQNRNNLKRFFGK